MPSHPCIKYVLVRLISVSTVHWSSEGFRQKSYDAYELLFRLYRGNVICIPWRLYLGAMMNIRHVVGIEYFWSVKWNIFWIIIQYHHYIDPILRGFKAGKWMWMHQRFRILCPHACVHKISACFVLRAQRSQSPPSIWACIRSGKWNLDRGDGFPRKHDVLRSS